MLRSIGYRGVAMPGVPFDDEARVIPNVEGRVTGAPRTYAVGWIKRGPTGFIGTNKSCSQETVGHLIDDFNAGLLGSRGSRASLRTADREARSHVRSTSVAGAPSTALSGRRGWVARGARSPTVDELLEAAQPARVPRRGLSNLVRT